MSRMTLFWLPIIVLFVTVWSCAPAIATRVTRFATYPPKPLEHEIQIYRTGTPDRPYEEIGLVRLKRHNRYTSMEVVLESMKKEVREMGGDAVIGLTENNEVAGFVPLMGSVFVTYNRVLSGTVIRFLPAP